MMRQQHDPAVREAPDAAARQLAVQSSVSRSWRGVIVATIAALLMAYLGAFGTDSLPLGSRLGYWLIIMEAGALIGIGASAAIHNWAKLAGRPMLEGAAISVLIALPLTFVVIGTTTLFFGPVTFQLAGAASVFISVLIITAIITAINFLAARRALADPARHDGIGIGGGLGAFVIDTSAPAPEIEALPIAEQSARLRVRLPHALRTGDIYALEAEDHYVRVHTSFGSDLVLIRMTDAIEELDGLAGARTHRSWWVARDAVEQGKRSSGRAELHLVNGATATVSRSALPDLVKAGWFD